MKDILKAGIDQPLIKRLQKAHGALERTRILSFYHHAPEPIRQQIEQLTAQAAATLEAYKAFWSDCMARALEEEMPKHPTPGEARIAAALKCVKEARSAAQKAE